MRATELDTRLVLQSPQYQQQTDGSEAIAGWRDVATVYASVEQLSSTELRIAHTYSETATVKVTMRYLPSVSAKQRLLDPESGKTFYVEGNPKDVGRRRWLELTCTEAVL